MNVNEPLPSDLPRNKGVVSAPLPHSTEAAHVDIPGSSGVAVAGGAPDTPLIVAPDPTLPLPSERPPVNWSPDPSLLAWADRALDSVEWTEAQRLAIQKEFSPRPEFDHLFTAVPTPDSLTTAMEHPVTVKRDYLFSRVTADDFFP